MIPYPASLKAVGGAKTGIAPVNLLEVQDVNGNCYQWADRPVSVTPLLYMPALVPPTVGAGGLVGAFSDSNGRVIQAVAIGDGPVTLTVPSPATQLQLGVDAESWANNSGSWTVSVSVNGAAATDVTVPGNTMPWVQANNPNYALANYDGAAPVVAASGLADGDLVTIAYVFGQVLLGSANFPYADRGPAQTLTYLNAAGSLSKNVSSSLGPYQCCALWTDFNLFAPLPADAVIIGIYPVMVAAVSAATETAGLTYGSGLNTDIYALGGMGGSGFHYPTGRGSSFASTELWSDSIGTSLAALSGQEMGAEIKGSSNSNFTADTINVSAAGFAVLYSSATAPSEPPPIPNPFAPPAGQYFAWALPRGAQSTGTQPMHPFASGTMGTQSATASAASAGFQDSSGSQPSTVAPSSVATPRSYMNSDAPASAVVYAPWLLQVPAFTFHRSLQTDIGNFVLQNLSGDTVSRDFEKIMRRSALEGAFFVYRLWQPDAEAAWLEVHGTLTVEDVPVDTVTLKGSQSINPAQDDTPLEEFSETCQLNWAKARCGSTQPTECQYSFQTCQVIERFFGVLNSFEKNYGDTQANVPTQTVNRQRKV